MLTFYTNPQSRGRIARWMLEEIGQPYDTVVLDYGTSDEGARVSGDQPDGQGARRWSTTARSSPKAPRSAPIWPMAFPEAGLMAEDTRRLLPLDVLRRRAAGAGGGQHLVRLAAKVRRQSAG